MTPDEILAILKRHDLWLCRDPRGARANLSLQNLSGGNFARVNLSMGRLVGTNLSACDLVKANLSNADLFGADLSDCMLNGAVMAGADLRGARLRNADMTGADLSGCDLREGALLRPQTSAGLSFVKTDVSESKLDKAKLRGANLSGANLRKSSLVGSDLNSAQLAGAKLQGAVLTNAALAGANLQGTDLSGRRSIELRPARCGPRRCVGRRNQLHEFRHDPCGADRCGFVLCQARRRAGGDPAIFAGARAEEDIRSARDLGQFRRHQGCAGRPVRGRAHESRPFGRRSLGCQYARHHGARQPLRARALDHVRHRGSELDERRFLAGAARRLEIFRKAICRAPTSRAPSCPRSRSPIPTESAPAVSGPPI